MTGPIVRNQEFGSCDCKTVMRIVSPPPLPSCWLLSVGELYTEEMVYPSQMTHYLESPYLQTRCRWWWFDRTTSDHHPTPAPDNKRTNDLSEIVSPSLSYGAERPKRCFISFNLKFYLPWYFVMSKTRNWRLQKSTRIGRRREIFNLNSLET